jgi:hypothetical protein
VFNLSRPEKSMMLLAPLAKQSGGHGLCAGSVFETREDADYRSILAMCIAGKQRLEQIKRFDMAGFRPDPAYLREMRRYGVLAADPTSEQASDVYSIDQRYWQSLWYVPVTPAAQ